ncbi:MAG: nucleotide pyrophosphohydrolase [Candidatus Helarchaeota archaeon]
MSELTFKIAQKKVDKFINSFEEGYWPPFSMLASIMEEVGELSREINAYEGYKPKKIENSTGNILKNIGIELGDITFSLICLANYFKIDLGENFEKALKKYEKRDSNRWTKKNI